MARAIADGAAAAGASLTAWRLAEPEPARHAHFQAMGIQTFTDAASAMADAVSRGPAGGEGVRLLLAIKPQVLAEVSAGLAHVLPVPGVPIVSILAGTTIERLHHAFPGCRRVVRAMPNLAARIGMGVTAFAASPQSTPEDLDFARSIFESVGSMVVSIDESLMDAFTALAGSGPAYLFFLAEAMARAGVELGFDDDTAQSVTRQTLAGAARLLAETPDRPEALRAAVTSKGGTTQAALAVLERRGVAVSILEAMAAARDRGRELSRF